MRRTFTLLTVALLCLGTFAAVADAGKKKKKKKTQVVYFVSSPKFSKGGKVTAKGTLNTVSACKPGRGVKLQILDANGAVFGLLDGSVTDSAGNWKLSAQLPKPLPPGTNSVRVKATKRPVKKFFCKAGVSPPAPVPEP
jgi:hypothetical protein